MAKKMDEFKDSADQTVFNLETARLNLLVSSRLVHVCIPFHMDTTKVGVDSGGTA